MLTKLKAVPSADNPFNFRETSLIQFNETSLKEKPQTALKGFKTYKCSISHKRYEKYRFLVDIYG